MRRILFILPLLVGFAAHAGPRHDHDEARQLRAAGAILPLEQLVEDARKRHPGQVLEAELKSRDGRYIYEIELLDEAGAVRELRYDAASGELLGEERDD